MKVIAFQINNARRIKTALLEFNETGITAIKGDNKQGKTTIIDVLCGILGKDHLHPQMISNGEEKITLKLETDEYVIKRSYSADKDYLTVSKVIGDSEAKIDSPQKFINSLISWIALEPMKFVQANPEEKKKLLMKELGLDFTEIDGQLKKLEEDRKFKSREIKALGTPVLPEKPKGEKIDVSKENEEKNKIIQNNKDRKASYDTLTKIFAQRVNFFQLFIDDQTRQLEKAKENLTIDIKDKERIKSILTRERENNSKPDTIAFFETLLNNIDDEIAHLSKVIAYPILIMPSLAAPVYKEESTEAIDQKINSASETNAFFDNYEKIERELSIIETKKKEYQDLSDQIEEKRKIKNKKLADCNIGIDNLEILDDGIYWNGIFSEDWSDMEKMKLAVTFGLKRSKLRLIAINGFEMFSKTSQKEFEQWLIANDIQALVTQVSDNIEDAAADESYFIEAGEIVYKPKRPDRPEQKTKDPRDQKEVDFDQEEF